MATPCQVPCFLTAQFGHLSEPGLVGIIRDLAEQEAALVLSTVVTDWTANYPPSASGVAWGSEYSSVVRRIGSRSALEIVIRGIFVF